MNAIRLRVRVVDGDTEFRLEIAVSPTDLLAEVIERIIQFHKLTGIAEAWGFYKQAQLLSRDSTAGFFTEVELVMQRIIQAPPGGRAYKGLLGTAPSFTPAPAPARVPKHVDDDPGEDGIVFLNDDEDEDVHKLDDLAEMLSGFPEASTKSRTRAGSASASSLDVPAAPTVKRRATVRYYSRMNPQRTYPFLVILSAEQIAEIVKKRVKQVEGTSFEVTAGSQVEIEPILPGCQCYPPRETITIGNEAVTAEFWVVPQVLGAVQGARVVVRQGGVVLSEVKLEMRVSKQTLTIIFGLLGLVSPYATMGLKQLKLDPDSQKQQNFELYRVIGSWVVENLRPEFLGFGLLGLAVMSYFWFRPRQRDVFWDITTQPAKLR